MVEVAGDFRVFDERGHLDERLRKIRIDIGKLGERSIRGGDADAKRERGLECLGHFALHAGHAAGDGLELGGDLDAVEEFCDIDLLVADRAVRHRGRIRVHLDDFFDLNDFLDLDNRLDRLGDHDGFRRFFQTDRAFEHAGDGGEQEGDTKNPSDR